jgi:hypothetical protein
MATSSANDPQWVNPGWNCLSHTWCSPRRQESHWPHAQTNGTVTSMTTPVSGHTGSSTVTTRAAAYWVYGMRVRYRTAAGKEGSLGICSLIS